MNLKITISYDGTNYQGSQKQPNKKTIENILLDVFKSINIDSNIIFSGRTDKGVHATGQVFNIKVPSFWANLFKLKTTINNKLPNDIKIINVKNVDDNFHARFNAKQRIYRYILIKQTTPFNAKYTLNINYVDKNILKKAIKKFEGTHNFEYFHKKGSDKINLIKTISKTDFYEYKNYYIFKFKANSYLRSQIRLMVGFLLQISMNKHSIEDLKSQLNRKKFIKNYCVSPTGLYLSKVIY